MGRTWYLIKWARDDWVWEFGSYFLGEEADYSNTHGKQKNKCLISVSTAFYADHGIWVGTCKIGQLPAEMPDNKMLLYSEVNGELLRYIGCKISYTNLTTKSFLRMSYILILIMKYYDHSSRGVEIKVDI